MYDALQNDPYSEGLQVLEQSILPSYVKFCKIETRILQQWAKERFIKEDDVIARA